jgi:nucleoside-diphosphate-sugar epimerase
MDTQQETVLVTGISGFVAGHVAVALLNAGYSVRGSVRSLSKADGVRKALAKAGADVSALEFCAVDLMQDDGWDDAMVGIDRLCHCASPFVAEEPKDPQELIGPAVEGTRRALNAALKAGVKHIALTSSFVAIGYGGPEKSAAYTEDDWSVVGGPGTSAYGDSKTLAEQEAWKIMREANAEKRLTTVNPVLVLGPALHDDLSTSTVLVKRLLKGEFPFAPRFSIPIVDVRDVAALHVVAVSGSHGGQRILAGDDTLWVLEMAQALRKVVPGARLPKSEAPNFLIRIFGLFDKSVAGIVHELGLKREVDSSRAEAALGRPLIDARDALCETARSLKALGAI